jgi:hypothetical protein
MQPFNQQMLFDIPPCLKAGDSDYWFSDSTYRRRLPYYDRGAYLPSRSGFLPSSLLPKGTVLPLHSQDA